MTGRLTALLALALFAANVRAESSNFPLHAFHKEKFGGKLECNLCHAPVQPGAVMLRRPGHEQCKVCHASDFAAKVAPETFCSQCHASPAPGALDVIAFPRPERERAVLLQFSHAKHTDPKSRIDPATGFRADCGFCHKFDALGAFATFPTHDQCAACHSKPGMKAQLTRALRPEGCRGCHMPEEIEKIPGGPQNTNARIERGRYADIRFSHADHFKDKGRFNVNCTTCHSDIPGSADVRSLALPKMIDCVQCHDSPRAINAAFRMSNCKTCHIDIAPDLPVPDTHTRSVKPASHTETFRRHHESLAAEAGAKCFVCHQNITPSSVPSMQCMSCHQMMRPANHTARWKDDLHGKYAALDRTVCATCHTAAYCSDCHNEQPRSHQPLSMFKAGAHAFAARLNLRTCLTCHTFQNTCSECHSRQFSQSNGLPR